MAGLPGQEMPPTNSRTQSSSISTPRVCTPSTSSYSTTPGACTPFTSSYPTTPGACTDKTISWQLSPAVASATRPEETGCGAGPPPDTRCTSASPSISSTSSLSTTSHGNIYERIGDGDSKEGGWSSEESEGSDHSFLAHLSRGRREHLALLRGAGWDAQQVSSSKPSQAEDHKSVRRKKTSTLQLSLTKKLSSALKLLFQ